MAAVHKGTAFLRRLEIAAAWTGATLAFCAAGLALLGPHLGGPAPGLEGLPGFLVEMATATWIHTGALSAVVAVLLLWRRQRWPAAVLGVVALTALLPRWWPHHAPSLIPQKRTLRVAAVNLCAESRDVGTMEASLRELDADVLVLPEFTTFWAGHLERWFTNDYAHRWLGKPSERDGYALEGARIAVWSRIPGTDFGVREGYGCQVRVTLDFCGHAFALYGVHTWPPFPFRQYDGVRCERQALLDWIRAESLPVIAAGDFNASPESPFLLRLRQCGLAIAAEEALGSAPVTWPMTSAARAPWGIAIDHVLHGAAFAAVGFRRGIANGSDHAPVVAELAWRD